MSKLSDKEKESMLLQIAKENYSQGDSYFAYKSKKANWIFGHSNDYALQHGAGDQFHLPDKILDLLVFKLGEKAISDLKMEIG